MKKAKNRSLSLDDVTTNEIFLRRTGLLAEGTWSILNYTPIALLVLGVLHYFGKQTGSASLLVQCSNNFVRKIVLRALLVYGGGRIFLPSICFESDFLELLDLMKAFHLSAIYFSGAASSYSILSGSKLFLEMHTMIKSGFKYYKTPYSEAQIRVQRKTNQRIVRNTRIFMFIFIFSLIGSILREGLPDDFEEWTRNYPGWFPIKINSWPRFIVSQVFHIIIAIALGGCSCTFFTVFVTIADHICAQIEILKLAVTEAFDPKNNSMIHQNNVVDLKEQIISCIKHHIEILRCIDKFQKYYNQVLIYILTGASVVLCTMAYMITDPKTSFSTVVSILTLGISEVCFSMLYCINGQKITNLMEELRFTIYNNTFWYSQQMEIRFYILMMLTRTKKPVTLTAGGLTSCNLAGYKDIVQGTWAYFNMLRAFRGKD